MDNIKESKEYQLAKDWERAVNDYGFNPQTVCSRYPRNAPHTAAKPLQVGKRVYRGHGGRDTQLRRPQPCIARGSEVHHGIPQGSRETHPIKITDV